MRLYSTRKRFVDDEVEIQDVIEEIEEQSRAEHSLFFQRRPAATLAEPAVPPPAPRKRKLDDAAVVVPDTISDYWLQQLDAVQYHYQKKYEEHKTSLKIRSRAEVIRDTNSGKRKNAGYRRMQKIKHMLNNMLYKGKKVIRSPSQITFHNGMLQACLPKIFADDWAESAVRVLEELGQETIKYEVMIQSPRRFGKTWSIAMFCTALLLCCPGIKLAIFSTGKRASSTLLETILEFMEGIPDAKERVCKQTEEQLYVALVPLPDGVSNNSSHARALRSAETTSRLLSFPSSVNGKQFSYAVSLVDVGLSPFCDDACLLYFACILQYAVVNLAADQWLLPGVALAVLLVRSIVLKTLQTKTTFSRTYPTLTSSRSTLGR